MIVDPSADQDWTAALRDVYGLNETETRIFLRLLTTAEPLTVDELGDTLDRERTTVYRYLKRLSRNGLVRTESVSTDGGGYCHTYYAEDPATIATEMRHRTNDLYAQLDELIRAFRAKYDARDDQVEPPSPRP